jgi:hypothetical protein
MNNEVVADNMKCRSCGAWICRDCLSCSSDCGCAKPNIPCDCWKHEKQVCDVCQGVAAAALPAVEQRGETPDYWEHWHENVEPPLGGDTPYNRAVHAIVVTEAGEQMTIRPEADIPRPKKDACYCCRENGCQWGCDCCIPSDEAVEQRGECAICGRPAHGDFPVKPKAAPPDDKDAIIGQGRPYIRPTKFKAKDCAEWAEIYIANDCDWRFEQYEAQLTAAAETICQMTELLREYRQMHTYSDVFEHQNDEEICPTCIKADLLLKEPA